AVERLAEYLDVSPSEVYGVASFYTQFKFNPPGKHIIQVCQGTACHVRGSKMLIDVVKQDLGIEPGQTTSDGEYSLERVACIGCCALAPAVVVDGNVHAQVTPALMRELIKKKDR
ncbi:MAG: NAD(P)H-dependent oxidoreductase subunit E, partial [Candidatus Hydrogenedentes bacterium]|nr:NAD(P)H-dependent oxidoreductase subunit E [Candidatus Hydrogenedentota bacterium]